MKRVLAVDLGGTKTATALVDEAGLISDLKRQPAARSVEASVAQIVEAAAGGISAIGVIVPGIYDTGTGDAWCPNLWGMEEVPLLARLRREFRAPIVIESDRAGYVTGESWLGASRGIGDAVFVALGTGIGVGILSGGRLIRGAHGIAGAAGWMAVGPEWRREYEQCGCWESESAGPAVAWAFGASSAVEVAAAANAGDANAIAVLRHAASYAGRGVANIISLLNPQIVVIGGGLAQAAFWMLDAIREECRRWAQPVAARRCRIEMTQLGENAGLLGAAKLALDRM